VTSLATSHGLCGKQSNRSKQYILARELFRKFVESVRTTTGRTKDKHGRHHGPAWHLWIIFSQLRFRTEKDKEDENNKDLEKIFSWKAAKVLPP
jgi:hypothetical protein